MRLISSKIVLKVGKVEVGKMQLFVTYLWTHTLLELQNHFYPQLFTISHKKVTIQGKQSSLK